MGVGRGGMAAGAGGEDEGGSAAYRMAGGDLQQCQSPGSPFDDPWLSWQLFCHVMCMSTGVYTKMYTKTSEVLHPPH
eukprot:scaffold180986_cov21-Tisochrysis_lutea.AAC.1